jgi:hypothetical protein
MIAKNIKGKSFKGCVSYVMHEGATLLEAEGVWAETKQDIIRSFAMQRSGRKEIKQPVGHIPIAFSPEDKDRMTDEFMVKLAKEYMQEMGIGNTQYIIVRHHNTDNPHLHIVYNRINNGLKLISVNHDYKRNVKVCKKLKDKYNLTYGEGKEKVRREKLDNPDKAKYYIHDSIKLVLTNCKNLADLRFSLQKFGIEIEYKYKRTTNEIEGVSFRYNNICFKGSQIDRKFSYGNLKKEFEKNIELLQEQVKKRQKQQEKQPSKVQQQTDSKPKNPTIGGVELTPAQWKTLQNDGFIYLGNMNRSDDKDKFSSYIFLNEEKNKAFFSKNNPDEFVKFGKYEMRIRDKILIENGYVTKAKIKWWGGGSYAYPYLWKVNKSDAEYQESWDDPRIKKEKKQKNTLQKVPKEQKKKRGRGV